MVFRQRCYFEHEQPALHSFGGVSLLL